MERPTKRRTGGQEKNSKKPKKPLGAATNEVNGERERRNNFEEYKRGINVINYNCVRSWVSGKFDR